MDAERADAQQPDPEQPDPEQSDPERADARRASGSAVWVCQGRAVAHGRVAPGRFADPTARALLRPDEAATVDWARSDEPPAGPAARLNWRLLRLNGLVNVPRTVAIDDAVRAAPGDQVVVLGAGLDGRAWRLEKLAGTRFFEVDHPASQADKEARAAALGEPVADRHLVPVDLRTGELGPALAGAGHDAGTPTTWIWEGVVPYLTPAEVEATVAAVAGRSAPGSRLVIHYLVPSRRAAIGRRLARALLVMSGGRDPMADEPRRSTWTPPTMAGLLGRHGFGVVADDDLADVAETLGVGAGRRRLAGASRLAVAERGDPAVGDRPVGGSGT